MEFSINVKSVQKKYLIFLSCNEADTLHLKKKNQANGLVAQADEQAGSYLMEEEMLLRIKWKWTVNN